MYKNKQYYKFCLYGFFKNLQLFEPFLMLFFIDKGISFLQIGSLYAIREITTMILELPTGIFADIIGRRKTMIASFLGYIISFVIFFYSTNYLYLTIAMLLFSLGDALRTGTHKAMIIDYLKIKKMQHLKLRYYGETRSWSQIGAAVSSLLAAAVVIYFQSYKYIFLISTVPYIIDLALVWSYPKSLDGPIKGLQNHTLKSKLANYFMAIKTSFKNLKLWYNFTNLSIFQGFFKSIKDYLQPLIIIVVSGRLIHDKITPNNKETLIIGIIYFIIFLISSTTSRNANKLTDCFKSDKMVLNTTLYSGLVLGALIGVLVYTQVNLLAILLFVFIFINQNIRKPFGTVVIANQVKNETMATSLSVQSQLDSIFTALFSLLLGALAQSLKLGTAITIFTIAIIILSLLIEASSFIIKQKSH